MSVFQELLRPFYVSIFEGPFVASSCTNGSAIDLTVRLMGLRAWFCITSNLLKAAGAVGHFMYALYAALMIDPELPHLLPASIFRTVTFSLLYSTVFSTQFLHVGLPSRYIPNYFARWVLLLIFRLTAGSL